MVHTSEKGSETDKTIGKYPDGVSPEDQPKKTCADCGTTKTPLWRGGPAGPKSLCNACGIRSRKKSRAILGMNKKSKKSTIESSGGGGGSKLGDLLKQRLVSLGREVMRQRSPVEKRRRKLREEEQAAVLLMALSYGSVYA